MDNGTSPQYVYDQYIKKLEDALLLIRDSTFRNAVTLRAIAADVLSNNRRPD